MNHNSRAYRINFATGTVVGDFGTVAHVRRVHTLDVQLLKSRPNRTFYVVYPQGDMYAVTMIDCEPPVTLARSFLGNAQLRSQSVVCGPQMTAAIMYQDANLVQEKLDTMRNTTGELFVVAVQLNQLQNGPASPPQLYGPCVLAQNLVDLRLFSSVM